MPRFNSDAEKAEWIMTHPEDYERMTGEKVSSVVPEFKTKEEKDAWLRENGLLADHPQTTLSTTNSGGGSPQRSEADLQAEKMEKERAEKEAYLKAIADEEAAKEAEKLSKEKAEEMRIIEEREKPDVKPERPQVSTEIEKSNLKN